MQKKKSVLMQALDALFGPSQEQAVLAKSEDKRFINYLRSVEAARIVLFPVNVALVASIGVIALLLILLEIIAAVISGIYEYSIDAHWISPSAFKITKDDYKTEFEKLKA